MNPGCPVLLGASAGFLLAVLWFDLMFDAQVRRFDAPDGDARLTSIADYYRRVTIEAFPANQLVAAVMLLTIAGTVLQLWRTPSWRGLAALVLIVGSVSVAGWRVLPNATRLGARRDPLPLQRDLARTIWRDHLLCFAAILTFLALQL